MKVLVLGATGMLGSAIYSVGSKHYKEYEIYATTRKTVSNDKNIISGVDVNDFDTLVRALSIVKPDVVINCIGIIKQLEESNDPLCVLPLNSLFPHKLKLLSYAVGFRLIHISTDCVFDGKIGDYQEDSLPNATDLYGVSKHIGEIVDHSNLTLRTSIIGHELYTKNSLVDWFLSADHVTGYKNAIFSGLPTSILAEVIFKRVLPNKSLVGLYHVSADPISKFDLLEIIAKQYGKHINIAPDYSFSINRSLNSEKFRSNAGFKPDSWPIMIQKMHEYWKDNFNV